MVSYGMLEMVQAVWLLRWQRRACYGYEPLDFVSRCAAVSLATGAVQGGVFRTAAQVASEEAQADEYIDIAR